MDVAAALDPPLKWQCKFNRIKIISKKRDVNMTLWITSWKFLFGNDYIWPTLVVTTEGVIRNKCSVKITVLKTFTKCSGKYFWWSLIMVELMLKVTVHLFIYLFFFSLFQNPSEQFFHRVFVHDCLCYSQIFMWTFGRSHQRCSVRKGVLIEISQNSQENTCARASFLIKLQA